MRVCRAPGGKRCPPVKWPLAVTGPAIVWVPPVQEGERPLPAPHPAALRALPALPAPALGPPPSLRSYYPSPHCDNTFWALPTCDRVHAVPSAQPGPVCSQGTKTVLESTSWTLASRGRGAWAVPGLLPCTRRALGPPNGVWTGGQCQEPHTTRGPTGNVSKCVEHVTVVSWGPVGHLLVVWRAGTHLGCCEF